jgi:hypothetical protein
MLPKMLYDLVFYLNVDFEISNQLVVVTIITLFLFLIFLNLYPLMNYT